LCDIFVPYVHVPVDDKIDNLKDSISEELESVFYKFPIYHKRNLLVYISAKIGKEDICNKQLRMRVYANLVMIKEILNLATSENHTVKSTEFPHCNIHKFTRTLIESPQSY
jgi:hypothetical protein